ncbi:universal stress protein [Lentzea sp. NPDC092896]|uniref:universal stress protein n=1 Tax=Lentzea sp. NPDC092896 TaxID=3364127 RepID=UPI0038112BA6
MRTPVILVGVDGSTESCAALRWAMEEAAHRGARVEAMFSYRQEPVVVPAVPMGLNPYGEMPQRHPARELHNTVQQVRATMLHPPDVAECVVVGDAADQLAEASKHAESRLSHELRGLGIELQFADIPFIAKTKGKSAGNAA